MNSSILRSGGDPRGSVEFDFLREEINKMSHPTQPEIDWARVAAQADALMARNGADLQTASYYALAQGRVSGLAGITEGCELLADIVAHHWTKIWPLALNVRVDILTWFKERTLNVMHSQTVNEKSVPLLYRIERALQIIDDRLATLPPSRNTADAAGLLRVIQQARQSAMAKPAVRKAGPKKSLSVPAARAVPSQPEAARRNENTLDAEALATSAALPAVNVAVRPWRAFIAGAAVTLLAVLVTFWSYVLPLHRQLEAVAQHPLGASLLWLNQPELESYYRQINRLLMASPCAQAELAARSVSVAQQRWPHSDVQHSQTRRWLTQTERGDALPGASYLRARQRVQQLIDELIAKENARSGITISYLKTAIYDIQRDLTADVPLDALLAQLAAAEQHDAPAQSTLQKAIDARWLMLNAQYYALMSATDTPQSAGAAP